MPGAQGCPLCPRGGRLADGDTAAHAAGARRIARAASQPDRALGGRQLGATVRPLVRGLDAAGRVRRARSTPRTPSSGSATSNGARIWTARGLRLIVVTADASSIDRSRAECSSESADALVERGAVGVRRQLPNRVAALLSGPRLTRCCRFRRETQAAEPPWLRCAFWRARLSAAKRRRNVASGPSSLTCVSRPIRMCAGCRGRDDKAGLIRIVARDGVGVIDHRPDRSPGGGSICIRRSAAWILR